MDSRAAAAREHHRAAAAAEQDADRHRQARDNLIRALRTEDPALWTYPRLAAEVGCSPELIAAVVKGRRPR